MNQEAYKKMVDGRVTLILERPFYGALALKIILKEDTTHKTAWINGKYLGYNPDFVNGLSHAQIVALFEHEISHCAYGHPWRRDNRDFKRFNKACDKAINTILRENGSILPPNAYYAEGEEIGKSAEWIYNRLPQPEEKPESGSGGSGKPQPGAGEPSEEETEEGEETEQPEGDEPGEDEEDAGEPSEDAEEASSEEDNQTEVRDAPTDSDEEGDAPTEEDWQQATVQAMVQAQAMGKLPGGMARAIKDAQKPKVDVKALVLRFCQERTASDYTWTSPNPRYIASGLYLPKLESKTLGNIAIYVDTSGSMDTVALKFAKSVIEEVIEEVRPSSVTVYYGDSEVTQCDRFEQGEELVWNAKGGGGTDFIPFLKAVEEDGESVCALCISDLDGSFPESCDIPTVWLATPLWGGNRTLAAPFGETIPVEY